MPWAISYQAIDHVLSGRSPFPTGHMLLGFEPFSTGPWTMFYAVNFYQALDNDISGCGPCATEALTICNLAVGHLLLGHGACATEVLDHVLPSHGSCANGMMSIKLSCCNPFVTSSCTICYRTVDHVYQALDNEVPGHGPCDTQTLTICNPALWHLLPERWPWGTRPCIMCYYVMNNVLPVPPGCGPCANGTLFIFYRAVGHLLLVFVPFDTGFYRVWTMFYQAFNIYQAVVHVLPKRWTFATQAWAICYRATFLLLSRRFASCFFFYQFFTLNIATSCSIFVVLYMGLFEKGNTLYRLKKLISQLLLQKTCRFFSFPFLLLFSCFIHDFLNFHIATSFILFVVLYIQ